MQSIRRLMIFGTQSAREQAKILLENQPDIKRIDPSADLKEIRLFCPEGYTECELVALLARSGIDAFRLLPAANHKR